MSDQQVVPVSRSSRLDGVLTRLLTQAPELEAASVVSFDGLPMASALPEGMDEDRVAAMSAALLSLGERAASGLGRGELSQLLIEGDAGTVLLVSADDEAVLVAVATPDAKIGMVRYEARRAASAVAEVLRAQDEPTPLEQAAHEVVRQAAPVHVPMRTAVPADRGGSTAGVPTQAQPPSQPQPQSQSEPQSQPQSQPQPQRRPDPLTDALPASGSWV